MSSITIPCENPGEISDGFHTFDELYEHRAMLFFALMRAHPERAWRSLRHVDGSRFEDYFICGINLPSGPVTYHYPLKYWTLLDGLGIETLELAPEWDGHTSQDVISRLRAWVVDPTPHDRPNRMYVERRRPEEGETALTFLEGGTIYVVPNVHSVMLPDGSMYDQTLRRLGRDPWLQPAQKEEA